jgi:hypothetical protein
VRLKFYTYLEYLLKINTKERQRCYSQHTCIIRNVKGSSINISKVIARCKLGSTFKNEDYSEGKDLKDHSSKPAQAKS